MDNEIITFADIYNQVVSTSHPNIKKCFGLIIDTARIVAIIRSDTDKNEYLNMFFPIPDLFEVYPLSTLKMINHITFYKNDNKRGNNIILLINDEFEEYINPSDIRVKFNKNDISISVFRTAAAELALYYNDINITSRVSFQLMFISSDKVFETLESLSIPIDEQSCYEFLSLTGLQEQSPYYQAIQEYYISKYNPSEKTLLALKLEREVHY